MFSKKGELVGSDSETDMKVIFSVYKKAVRRAASLGVENMALRNALEESKEDIQRLSAAVINLVRSVRELDERVKSYEDSCDDDTLKFKKG